MRIIGEAIEYDAPMIEITLDPTSVSCSALLKDGVSAVSRPSL